MSITTILFDAGGVLVVPLDPVANTRRRNQLAAELGFSSGEEMWDHFFDSDIWLAAKTGKLVHTEMWETLLAPLGLAGPEDQATFLNRLYTGEGIHPGMRALIEALHRQYRLGILSNWDDRLEDILEERLGIAHYFDVIVNSHRIGVAKPDKQAYVEALRLLDVAPQEVLFIDDLERNTKVASELGMHTHIYRDLPTLIEELRDLSVLDGTEKLLDVRDEPEDGLSST